MEVDRAAFGSSGPARGTASPGATVPKDALEDTERVCRAATAVIQCSGGKASVSAVKAWLREQGDPDLAGRFGRLSSARNRLAHPDPGIVVDILQRFDEGTTTNKSKFDKQHQADVVATLDTKMAQLVTEVAQLQSKLAYIGQGNDHAANQDKQTVQRAEEECDVVLDEHFIQSTTEGSDTADTDTRYDYVDSHSNCSKPELIQMKEEIKARSELASLAKDQMEFAAG